MDEVRVTLDATEPSALLEPNFRHPPANVWLRLVSNRGPADYPEVEVRGERSDVAKFVALHWGSDQLAALVEDGEL